MTISDIVAIISAIIALVGVIFALVQWRHQIRLKRTEFVIALIDRLRNDDNIRETIYGLEYNKIMYSGKFHDSKDEQLVDQTLSYFSYICYLYFERQISDDEMLFVRYYIVRMLTNPSVRSYLFNIYHFSHRVMENAYDELVEGCSFYHLIRFGLERGILENAFLDCSKHEELDIKCILV